MSRLERFAKYLIFWLAFCERLWFLCSFELFITFSGCFKYFWLFIVFFLSDHSEFFLISKSNTFYCFSFTLFIISILLLSIPNFILMSTLKILTVCIRISNSFLFWAKKVYIIKWFNFSWDFLNLNHSLDFLTIKFNGIITTRNNTRNSDSPGRYCCG